MEFKRSQRVSELLKQEISNIIARDLKDPKVVMASVTNVRATDDLRYARVYVSVIGDEPVVQNTLQGLERAKKFIRSELGNRTNLRFVPELSFVHDRAAVHAQKIDSLLNQLHQEKNEQSSNKKS